MPDHLKVVNTHPLLKILVPATRSPKFVQASLKKELVNQFNSINNLYKEIPV